jgi:magnesium-transporting ATPase (P-type)
MDSLAALALATEMPKQELLERPPQDRKDHIVSRKMLKHIVLMALYMCIVLFIFIFCGEYIIPEPNAEYKFDR